MSLANLRGMKIQHGQSGANFFRLLSVPILAGLLGWTIPCLTQAEQLLSYAPKKKSGVSFEAVLSESSLVRVTIKAPDLSHSSVFALEGPSRIVVDIFGKLSVATRTLPAKANPLLKAVRLGAHKDKARLVLDLIGTGSPRFEVSQSPQAIEIRLLPVSPAAPKQPTAPASQSPTPQETASQLAPTPTAIAAVTSPGLAVPRVDLLKASRQATPIPPTPTLAESTATPAPTVTEPPASPVPALSLDTSGQFLREIDFGTLAPERVPVIRLVLNKRAEFKLSKKDARSYYLTIPDCALASPHLGLPFFVPQNFVGFTHVLAQPKKDDLQVTLGTDRNTKLAAFAQENEILVRTVPR